MKFKPRRFYRSKEEFRQIHHTLKQTPCPRCKSIGFLILHGYLRGHDEKVYGKRITRGHRIFCSNRNRRTGCGRTFSMLRALLLKGFTIGAKSLWHFLSNIAGGMNKCQAFKALGLAFSSTTTYRLWKRFERGQSRLRVMLSRLTAPPELARENSAAVGTILHLRSCFARARSPVAAFQNHCQTEFLR